MKQMSRIALAMLLVSVPTFAADQTWTGRISSSMCHPGKDAMDHACILNCVKAGAKYVFVAKGKSYEVQNQDFRDLEEHAGHAVKISGHLSSNGNSITITQLVMATPSSK